MINIKRQRYYINNVPINLLLNVKVLINLILCVIIIILFGDSGCKQPHARGVSASAAQRGVPEDREHSPPSGPVAGRSDVCGGQGNQRQVQCPSRWTLTAPAEPDLVSSNVARLCDPSEDVKPHHLIKKVHPCDAQNIGIKKDLKILNGEIKLMFFPIF